MMVTLMASASGGVQQAGFERLQSRLVFDLAAEKIACKACHNGDFCVDSPNVNWKVVPGTARFALQSGAMFNETVMNALNKGITQGLGQTIRLPLASATGVLGDVPLKSEGRVDTGAGFFGACLKPDLN